METTTGYATKNRMTARTIKENVSVVVPIRVSSSTDNGTLVCFVGSTSVGA